MPDGVIAIDQHGVGIGDFERARGDRRQHGVEVERGGDRAADLLEHLQLVDRLREVARALLHLLFEAGIGLRKLPGHAVELACQFFQLVRRLHLDAVGKIAGAEAAGAGAERGDRHQHPSRHDGAGDDRDHEAERDQQRNPHQLVADRRQRLRGRLLEEHVPAELRHLGRGGQHGIAARVLAGSPRDAVRRHHGRDLRQRCEVPADLGALRGVRQHLALAVDDIGLGRLADLGVAQEVVEEGEVDFGDGDAGIVAGMRQRERHEGTLLPKMGRGKADAPRQRLGEAEVAGEIRIAADRDGLPRQPQRFAALAVDLGQLVDRRHLVEQLGIVGAALLGGGGGGAGDPADLPIEVGHRLLDALGGRLRLLAHRIPQRGLDAAVADPGFQRAVDREHEHDKADQRDDVFGEQALPQEPDFVLHLVHPDPRAPLLDQNRVRASAVAPRQYSLLGRATLRACFNTK